MGFIKDFIQKIFDKCFFWLPSKFITRPISNAMIGFADLPIGANLLQLSWKQFQYDLGDTSLVLVGTDGGTSDFISKYKTRFNINSIVASEVGDQESFMGFPLWELSTLNERELSGKTIVITSIYFYRLYSNFLDNIGVSYYSYPHIECGKPVCRFFRPLYLLRYRWFHFLISRDGFFKNYSLFYLRAVLRTLHITTHRANDKKLKQLKDCHKGERCFVVATGPSLRAEDVERLRGEITFGVNSLFRIFEQTDWRPTYYAMSDCRVFNQYLQNGDHLTFDSFCTRQAILADTLDLSKLDMSIDESKLVRVPFSYLNHFTTAINVQKKYSTNPLWGLYSAQTVTNFAINMAQYMGFSEIYLLGVDFNYTTQAHHFDGSFCDAMNDSVIKQRVLDNTLDCYEMVQQETAKAGVRVYNASRHTNLETFPVVDFDKLSFLPPIYGKAPSTTEDNTLKSEMFLQEKGGFAFDYMLSIVMVTYNHEKFVRDALESILMQRVDFKYEVVIGDDCSPDNTQAILKEYEDQYPDIFKVHYHTENVGATKNVYEQFMRAKGKYIAYLEGDDYWIDPYKLQKQVMFLEKNPEYIATVHNCFIVNEDKQIIDRSPQQFSRSKYYSVRELERWVLPGQTATLVHRNIFLTEPNHDYTQYYKASPILGDTTTAMMLVLQGKFYRFPETMSHYRRVYRSNAMSWSSIPLIDRRFAIYQAMDSLKLFAQQEYGRKLDFSEQQHLLRYYLFVQYADNPTRHKREMIEHILANAGDKEQEYRQLLRKVVFKTPARKLKYRYQDWKKRRQENNSKRQIVYLKQESERQWKMNYERSIITREKIDKVIAQNKVLYLAALENDRKINALCRVLAVQLEEKDSIDIRTFGDRADCALFYQEEEPR